MAATTQFEIPVEHWFEGQYSLIPEHMQAALKRYVVDRIRPGSFLSAVISNDLFNTFRSADEVNVKLVPLYVRWFVNIAPAACWGNPDRLTAWVSDDLDAL